MIFEKIKTYLKTAAIVYVVAVTIAAAGSISLLCGKIKEVRRLEGNQDALMSDMVTYKTKSGLAVAEAKRLELTVSEYKSALQESDGIRKNQGEIISQLNLKVRRLESVAQTITEMKIDTSALFVPKPFTRDTLKLQRPARLEMPVSQMTGTIEWRDPWVSLKVRVEGERADVQIESVDTLYQVVHRVPKRFLCIPFGTKGIRQVIVSSNPHTKIVYSEYIELKKRK